MIANFVISKPKEVIKMFAEIQYTIKIEDYIFICPRCLKEFKLKIGPILCPICHMECNTWVERFYAAMALYCVNLN